MYRKPCLVNLCACSACLLHGCKEAWQQCQFGKMGHGSSGVLQVKVQSIFPDSLSVSSHKAWMGRRLGFTCLAEECFEEAEIRCPGLINMDTVSGLVQLVPHQACLTSKVTSALCAHCWSTSKGCQCSPSQPLQTGCLLLDEHTELLSPHGPPAWPHCMAACNY